MCVGYDGSYRNDFHQFDFIQCCWSVVVATGRTPKARYRGTCCVRGDAMYLFGGHDGTRHLNDVSVFDFNLQARCYKYTLSKTIQFLPS